MSRLARAVFASVPHHITERGNQERSWKGHYGKGGFSLLHWMKPIFGRAIRYLERNPVRAKIASKAE